MIGGCAGLRSLLERQRELGLIGGWLEDARSRRGRVVLVAAAPGLGKSALLAQAALMGEGRGLRVVFARGGELERGVPFGIARQLFEGEIRGMASSERRALLRGAAGRTRALLGLGREPGDSGDPLAVLHGLYWLAVMLADRQPVLLVIDDVHWGDAQSLRWLAYLVPRITDVAMVVVTAARPIEPGGAGLGAFTDLEEVVTVPLRPLGAEAVGELISARFGRSGDPGFVAACHGATGGNPFYIGELLRAAAADGIAPVDAQASALGQLGSREVARSILVRLARIGGSARRLADAIAVLGVDAEVRHAALLSGLAIDEALHTWDELARADILRPGQPLEFIHPIARTAVYQELGAGERSQSHRRAARMLRADRADPQRVAAHALACESTGDPEVVGWLDAAAESALAAGAPDAAVRYLQRALAEPPPPELRAQLNYRLGWALIGLRSASAAAHFAKAAETGDEALRALARRWEAYALGWAGRMHEAMAAYDRAIELAGTDTEAMLDLTGTREFYVAWWAQAPDRAQRRHRLRELAIGLEGTTPGERQALAALAANMVIAGSEPAGTIAELGNRLSRAHPGWLIRATG